MAEKETKQPQEPLAVTSFLFPIIFSAPLGRWLRTGFEDDWGWPPLVSRLLAFSIVIVLNLVFLSTIGRYNRKRQAGKKS